MAGARPLESVLRAEDGSEGGSSLGAGAMKESTALATLPHRVLLIHNGPARPAVKNTQCDQNLSHNFRTKRVDVITLHATRQCCKLNNNRHYDQNGNSTT